MLDIKYDINKQRLIYYIMQLQKLAKFASNLLTNTSKLTSIM